MIDLVPELRCAMDSKNGNEGISKYSGRRFKIYICIFRNFGVTVGH